MAIDLFELSDWLTQGQVTHVAMESTGVYWKPIYNILEGNFTVHIVNARHIKQVPGRKTDVKDAQWIAELQQHGLLKASFIPDTAQRDLRDLTRYRTHLIQERTREINCVHKLLEDANIKLSSVATDIMGVSGRDMLASLIAGEDDSQHLAQLARGRLKSKMSDLQKALQGHMRDSHRLLLQLYLEHIDQINTKLDRLAQEIDHRMIPFDEDDLINRLCTIPGVHRKVAHIIVAELGTDLSRFPNANHAASWAGLAPGKTRVLDVIGHQRLLRATFI